MKEGNFTMKTNKKKYGPLANFSITNDKFLSKIILRGAIAADINSEKHKQMGKTTEYISNYLDRCNLIRDIKKTSWILSTVSKKDS